MLERGCKDYAKFGLIEIEQSGKFALRAIADFDGGYRYLVCIMCSNLDDTAYFDNATFVQETKNEIFVLRERLEKAVERQLLRLKAQAEEIVEEAEDIREDLQEPDATPLDLATGGVSIAMLASTLLCGSYFLRMVHTSHQSFKAKIRAEMEEKGYLVASKREASREADGPVEAGPLLAEAKANQAPLASEEAEEAPAAGD